MKPSYTPDNTRSSVIVIGALAAVVILVAVLVGLSDKPQVDSILISADGSQPAPAAAAVTTAASATDGEGSADETDAGNGSAVNQLDDAATSADEGAAAGAAGAAGAAATTDDEANVAIPEPTREVIVVPTAEPTPTVEVAAAVEPAPEADESEGADGEVQAAPSLPTTSGTVQGTFFTRSDENEGATVDQNVITVSFAEDGSGAFQGVLDITYADGTHVLLNMSGPLTWLPTNPQVETMLQGAFTLDAPIDADDITTDDAELSITSLRNGSGSLCTTRCFGFTFPPP